jgi:cytochrome c-type biogenesis protein CcmH/NrfF
LLAAGTIIAFMPDRAYALAAAASKTDKTKAATTALVLLAMASFAGVARAQENAQVRPGQQMERATGDLHMARNDAERALFAELKCICECPHGLNECGAECGFAPARRLEVQRMLDEGRSHKEILEFEVAKYGELVLRSPMDKGYRRMVWLVPVGVLLGAIGMLVVVGRKWSRPKPPATTAQVAQAQARDEADYGARLDDELDELD